MVKNTTGGSKHKGLARKLVNAPVNNTLRLPSDDSECYAKVIKMLGNGMCHVNLVYKEQLHQNVVCHIRGKFKNKNKRANLVSVNDILLVGIRDWESHIHNCDLLFIYSNHNISLLSLPSLIQSDSITHHNNLNNNDNDISFSNSSISFDISYNNYFHQNDIINLNDI